MQRRASMPRSRRALHRTHRPHFRHCPRRQRRRLGALSIASASRGTVWVGVLSSRATGHHFRPFRQSLRRWRRLSHPRRRRRRRHRPRRGALSRTSCCPSTCTACSTPKLRSPRPKRWQQCVPRSAPAARRRGQGRALPFPPASRRRRRRAATSHRRRVAQRGLRPTTAGLVRPTASSTPSLYGTSRPPHRRRCATECFARCGTRQAPTRLGAKAGTSGTTLPRAAARPRRHRRRSVAS